MGRQCDESEYEREQKSIVAIRCVDLTRVQVPLILAFRLNEIPTNRNRRFAGQLRIRELLSTPSFSNDRRDFCGSKDLHRIILFFD